MRFQTKLSLLFGGLLILSLSMVMMLVGQITRKTVIFEIEQSLATTLLTVNRLHETRVKNLQQNVRLLAGDYGFKAAYGTEDTATIKTALQNHQHRLKDADLMILCDLDGLVLSNTFSDNMNGEPFPWMPVLDEAYDSDSGEVTAYAELDGTVYQLAVTPLLAPDLDAWIISGFRADHNMAIDLSALTSSEVTFVRNSGANTNLVASSLGSEQQAGLITFLQSTPLSSGLVQYRDNRETYIGNLIRLTNVQDLSFSIFVQQSLDAALDPYRELFWYSLLIFLVAIVMFAVAIVRTSRSVTSPITRLSAAAESVSKGQLDITLPVSSKDEIGILTRTFNEMTQGLVEKERVRDLLGKVVSPEIAKKLISQKIEVTGEQRNITVLFCDIQGFTSLSETKPPKEVLHSLNLFFSQISQIIESNGGVIDKYIGDAVMAIFGAPQDDPNHAANAVRAGLEICGQADALTQSLISKSGVPCQFGVGIHSGPVVAGNIGSSSRFNYTVIGDTVNVASRLESFGGRVYDARLIVTREVVDLCPDIGFVLLGEVNLKGRQQAAEIYTAQSIDPNSH